MEQPNLLFYNPFGNDSDSSVSSDSVRPSAFTGYRDTLVRLYQANIPESDPGDASYTPTQSGLSLFRSRQQLTHRDTLARLHFKQNLCKALPADVLHAITSYLDPVDCRHMRLTCRQWAEHLPQPRLSAAQRLPAEILLDIFNYLPAPDYDAARHTCKNWFLIGLDHKLARPMLKSLGSYHAYLRDLMYERKKLLQCDLQARVSNDNEGQTSSTLIDEEWLMSKRLATESRLSSSWRGSGLRSHRGHSLTSFTVVENISFERLLCHGDEQHLVHLSLLHFTVSSCGTHLLVTLDRDIFVYTLPSVEPVARLVAPSRVIAMSMETSSGRYSVAALAEGRLGLSWDLQNPDVGVGESPMNAQMILDDKTESVHGIVDVHTESPENSSPQLTSILPGLEIKTRPTVYRNLGTSSDSPRSVAICPQRKCVAFGCRSGVELHWRTPDSDTSLNRWFPLSAPSDHLYFLPQRPNIDSTKKLRLISSAAGPSRANRGRHDSAPTKWTFRSTIPHQGRMQSMTRLFFGSLPFPSALTRRSSANFVEDAEHRGVLRTVDCDHYRATPISDGAHMLFIDPATGLLCLGSDAPLGGPTKLMRKVCMIPPETDKPETGSALTCYRAGQDLRWGVRVVAAYGDGRVILYNISVDCFEKIRYIRSAPDVWDELAGVLGQSDLLMDVYMADQEGLNGDDGSKAFRSLQIDGLEIYNTDSEVEDIQVECAGGGVKVWLFLASSCAVKLSIYVPRNFKPVERYVGADGLVHPRASGRSPDVKGKARASDIEDDEATSRHVKFVLFE